MVDLLKFINVSVFERYFNDWPRPAPPKLSKFINVVMNERYFNIWANIMRPVIKIY